MSTASKFPSHRRLNTRSSHNSSSNSNSLFYVILSILITLLETLTIMPPSAEAFASLATFATDFPATTGATRLTTSAMFTKTATTPMSVTAPPSSLTSTSLGLRQRRTATSTRKRATTRLPPPVTYQKTFGQQSSPPCPDPFCIDCPDDLMVCSVISDPSSDAAGGNQQQQQEVFFDASNKRKPRWWWSRQTTSSSSINPVVSWKDKLLKVSNFASALCVIDCTLLPLVTIVLPLFGIVAASPAQMEWLHELGHQVALGFVMPVGTLATTLNYSNHGKLWISCMGWIGLVAILLANGGCHLPHFHGPLGHAFHELTHLLHHGIIHRVTNLSGCFLLLFSNFLSRRQKGACHDPACTRTH